MPRQLARSFVLLDHDAERVVERGRQTSKSLRNDETFEKSIAIGRAIEIGRNETMRLLHSDRPAGARWSRVFGAWLAENGFDEIDKGVRSRLQNCLDNLPAIEMWRQNIGLGQRLQLNHPNAVWRKWQAAKETPKGADRSTSPPPNRKDMEIVRLQEELDAANKSCARSSANAATSPKAATGHGTTRPTRSPPRCSRLIPTRRSISAAR